MSTTLTKVSITLICCSEKTLQSMDELALYIAAGRGNDGRAGRDHHFRKQASRRAPEADRHGRAGIA